MSSTVNGVIKNVGKCFDDAVCCFYCGFDKPSTNEIIWTSVIRLEAQCNVE